MDVSITDLLPSQTDLILLQLELWVTSRIMEMAAHVIQISPNTIKMLRTLIGRKIHTIYAPVLAVAMDIEDSWCPEGDLTPHNSFRSAEF